MPICIIKWVKYNTLLYINLQKNGLKMPMFFRKKVFFIEKKVNFARI